LESLIGDLYWISAFLKLEKDVISATLSMFMYCCSLPMDPPGSAFTAVNASFYPGVGDGGVIDAEALRYYPGIEAEGVVNPYLREYYVGDGAGGAIGFVVPDDTGEKREKGREKGEKKGTEGLKNNPSVPFSPFLDFKEIWRARRDSNSRPPGS